MKPKCVPGMDAGPCRSACVCVCVCVCVDVRLMYNEVFLAQFWSIAGSFGILGSVIWGPSEILPVESLRPRKLVGIHFKKTPGYDSDTPAPARVFPRLRLVLPRSGAHSKYCGVCIM